MCRVVVVVCCALFGARATATTSPATPPTVFLLIANEIAPTPSHRARIEEVAGWLASSEHPDHHDDDALVAAGLRIDLREFPREVDRVVDVLADSAVDLEGVVVATNHGLQRGVLQIAPPKQPLVDVGFTLPASFVARADERMRSSPIVDLENVDAILDASRAAFAADARFVVLVWSHGDEVFALTPRLGLPTTGLTKETLLARVHGELGGTVDLRAGDALRYGTRTVDLVAHVQQRLPTTSLLVLASCASTVEVLPSFPVLVAADGGGILIASIDMTGIVARRRAGEGLVDAVIATHTPKPFERADPLRVEARRRQARFARLWKLAPWLIPLAAWFVIVGVVVRRRGLGPRDP